MFLCLLMCCCFVVLVLLFVRCCCRVCLCVFVLFLRYSRVIVHAAVYFVFMCVDLIGLCAC